MSLSSECMKYLWGQRSAIAACSQTGKAGCFSLPHSAVWQGPLLHWEVWGDCADRLLRAGLWKPSLENTTARKSFFCNSVMTAFEHLLCYRTSFGKQLREGTYGFLVFREPPVLTGRRVASCTPLLSACLLEALPLCHGILIKQRS